MSCRPLWIIALFLGFCASCVVDPGQNARNQIIDRINAIQDSASGEQVVCFQQLIELDGANGQVERSIPVLAAFSLRFPDDPFKACTAVFQAEIRTELGQQDFADMYWREALHASLDPVMMGETAAYRAIMSLLEHNVPSEEKVALHSRLLTDFPDKVEQSVLHYQNGFLYESLGEFELSRREFESYLADPKPRSRTDLAKVFEIRERVNMYKLSPQWNQNRGLYYWSRKDLQQLIREIKDALQVRDIPRLKTLQSRNYFFAMSWLQEKINFNPNYVFDITRFIYGSRGIYFADKIESYSNSQEAYLKSWGWNRDVPIWYLYFRKVDFPADPQFDGTWEWAGLYFGDTLQTTETPPSGL